VPSKKKHHNQENVVKCPVDGCDYEGLSRGIHLHIRQSSGKGHGENGDVPENIDLDNLEVVGTKDVEMDYPEHRKVEDVVRLCPYCGRAYSGFHGVKIHLGQKQGQGVHPSNATDIEKEDAPVAKVDEDMNVIEIVESRSIMPSTKRRIESESNSVEKETVVNVVKLLEDQGMKEAADIVTEELL
jgi:hypothetical protein